jgi:hypothetical protein
MKTVQLSNGFECEVNEKVLNDMELLDLLAETKKDGSAYSDVVKKIFGDEEKQKLYDALRTEDGIVPLINTDGKTYSITDAVTEVMGALGPEGKN